MYLSNLVIIVKLSSETISKYDFGGNNLPNRQVKMIFAEDIHEKLWKFLRDC